MCDDHFKKVDWCPASHYYYCISSFSLSGSDFWLCAMSVSRVSKLAFYAQSTIAVISGRTVSRTLNSRCMSSFDSWMNDNNWRMMCDVHFKKTERSVHIFIWFVNEWHQLENYVWCPFQEDWTISGHIFIWFMNEWHGLEKYVWCPFQEDWTILGHIFIYIFIRAYLYLYFVRIICDVHFKNTTCFWISIEVVYLQCYLVVTWLVPREIAPISAHVLCTAYNHAPVYVTIRREYTYVGCMRV